MNMNPKGKKLIEKLKDKTLALFFTAGVSLKTWHEIGMIDREVAIYNELSKHFNYLADNITIIPFGIYGRW